MNKCQRCNRPLITPNATYGWRCAQILGINPLDPRVTGVMLQKIDTGIEKAERLIKNSPVQMKDKDKGDFYASFAKQSLWDGIDDFKVKEARKEGYSALNASNTKRTNIQKELEEYAKLHKDKKEEKKLAPNRTLSKVSKVLDTASTIPTLDRFASALQAPIDLAKGDYVSAALDVAGSVSGSSGISKLAKELWKTLKKQDKKTLDNMSNALTAASFIPGTDSVTNALQVPVDLARGDYFGAGMSALGVIPYVGEVADTAKIGRTTLKAATEGVELADDIGDAAKLADEAVDFAKTSGKVETIVDVTNKSDALKSIEKFPESVQAKAKSFFKGGSNKYNKFSAFKNENNTYTIIMEKPGDVPGSKAIYYRIIDSNGNDIKVYKETFDPKGNLIHRKEK